MIYCSYRIDWSYVLQTCPPEFFLLPGCKGDMQGSGIKITQDIDGRGAPVVMHTIRSYDFNSTS